MQRAGIAVLIMFCIAAIGTYIVYEALAQMYLRQPEQGSFRTYAKQALGNWAGFSNGWIYWLSEILILGSTLTALGLFTQFWLRSVPLWILSFLYALFGLLIVAIGVRGFERIENWLSMIKVIAIVVFIIVAVFIFFRYIPPKGVYPSSISVQWTRLFNTGFIHVWTSLIFCFYAFGGIEVLGLMATELKEPKDMIRAGRLMILLLTVLYLISVAFATCLIPAEKMTSSESPFILALSPYRVTVLLHFFNGVFIVAGFSVLIASIYSVTLMMVTLAEDGDAPRFFKRKAQTNARRLPVLALLFTAVCLFASVSLTLIVPKHIYEHLTTAAGIMLMYTWVFILLSSLRITKVKLFGHIKLWFGLFLVLLSIFGTLFDQSSRMGFFVSLVFLLVIVLISLLRQSISKRMMI